MEAGQDLNNFCRRLSGQFRNLMVLNAGISDTALLGVPESLLPNLREQCDLFSREDLLRLFEAFQRIETGMKYATQVRFQLEMGLIELAQVTHLRPLEDLIAEFAAMAEGAGSINPANVKTQTPINRSRPTIPPAPAQPRREPASAPTPAPAADASLYSHPEPADSIPLLQGPKDLLNRIAGAVGRESLESLMQNLPGARLEGDSVVLETGSINEFFRRQIKENLGAIEQAAGKVLGRKVRVQIAEQEEPALNSSTPQGKPPVPATQDLLEKAKREPVVKSFLDVFPGPVKAEKIDS